MVPHVRFEGGMGSKSALEAAGVLAKELGSWSTLSEKWKRLFGAL
jgi:hypothetical protein